MTTFKIVFKDTKKQDKTGLSLDEMIQFKLDNISNSNEYDILEDVEEKPKKKTKEDKALDIEEEKDLFLRSLSPAQMNDLNLGYKELIHHRGKWGLKVLKQPQESFYSPYFIKKERELKIKNAIKKGIRTHEDAIFIEVLGEIEGITDEEFSKHFTEILKNTI